MILEVLISCMHQSDFSLITKTGITGNALVINQCDKNEYLTLTTEPCSVRMISTTERGLSKSRNLAIKESFADICLFCDDDEHLISEYESIILHAFKQLKDADIIAFDVEGSTCRLAKKTHCLHYLELLRISSYQIAIRRNSIINANVYFDPFMGAGSGNGAQEENKFLMDCLRAGLKIYYVPQIIGRVTHQKSTWFHGYNEKFFYQRGGATRQLLGLPLALLYAFYYVIKKRALYKQEISLHSALFSTIKGCLNNPIQKQKCQYIREAGNLKK